MNVFNTFPMNTFPNKIDTYITFSNKMNVYNYTFPNRMNAYDTFPTT